MTEFIGSRISLISKSDIRYVGTLHEINSENSTVALEQVTSFGTEGRRNSPDDEIPGSDSVYEYIVFRGSDVKDLRIEEPPKDSKPAAPPQVPNDPAILGSGSRPQPQTAQQQPMQQPPTGPRSNQPPPFQQQPPFGNQYNQFQQNRFGPQGGPQPGFPGPQGGYPGHPGMPPYGAPPGWYPPPGQGFPPQPGPFSPHNQQQPPFGGPGAPPGPGMPPNAQQQQQRGTPKPGPPSGPGQTASPAAPVDSRAPPPQQAVENQPPTGPKADQAKSQSSTPVPTAPAANQGPPPPLDSKPAVSAALAPSKTTPPAETPANNASTVSRGKIVPAVPLPTTKIATKPADPLQSNPGNAQTTAPKPGQATQDAALQYQNATQAATAAVAAAMAKLPPAPGQKPRAPEGHAAVDNLTQKVNEMRTDDKNRRAQQQGSSTSYRGRGRGGTRRGGGARGVDVPSEDFDFETSNAKFNKQDLVKEAIATGSPVGTPTGEETLVSINGAEKSAEATENVVIPAAAPSSLYNKSSFFDNISSEAKERDDAAGRPSGYEMRTEERRRNYETFGMGSVDSGHRGGHRGRGRSRGGGYRGNYSRGRGSYNRGPRGGGVPQVAESGT